MRKSLKLLTVDIGTGTQDIFLFDSRLDLENGCKLVLPSPTMMMFRRIKHAGRTGQAILLTGRQMGGGPSAWAAEAHARLGFAVYATPDAATTLDDDLDRVRAMGIRVISDDEALKLPADVLRLEFGDLDLKRIGAALEPFGVQLGDLDAVAVGVFDHGAAPPGISDRRFRFDYLDRRIRERNSLTAFAYLSSDVPSAMSRLRAVADSTGRLDFPLVVMDTAPAAVLGATFDPLVKSSRGVLIANIGNFHALAFRLGSGGIQGVIEQHTGEIDRPKLEALLTALADGTLKNDDVFADMGHGALVYATDPLPLGRGDFDVVVTGPRRGMLGPDPAGSASHTLRPYFAVPFGDMMLAGCFGLLAATADLLPDFHETIAAALNGAGSRGIAPWDLD